MENDRNQSEGEKKRALPLLLVRPGTSKKKEGWKVKLRPSRGKDKVKKDKKKVAAGAMPKASETRGKNKISKSSLSSGAVASSPS